MQDEKSTETTPATKEDSTTKASATTVTQNNSVQGRQAQRQSSQFDYSIKLPEGATERQKELAKAIEEERKLKAKTIFDIKRFKRKLAYKLAEQEATKKLTEAASKNNTKNIGYLRRRKERLEFRISTEAYTLDVEKDLIRKKNEIDAQLNEAIKSYRAKRKAEFIVGDIAELNKNIEDSNKKILEIEKKLDDLYNELRKLSGQQRRSSSTPHKREKQPEQKPIEISLADIAIIKGKKEQGENDYDGE